MNKFFCYSIDGGEVYKGCCNSRDEAIEAAKEEMNQLGQDDKEIYIGTYKLFIPTIKGVDVYEITENQLMNEYLKNDKDIFEDVTDEQIERLGQMMSKAYQEWYAKEKIPNIYIVDDADKVILE